MGNQPSSPSSQPLADTLCGPECQKQKDLQVAFEAASADTDPLTKQLAQFNYNSVKNGPDWSRQEKAKIIKTQIDPVLKRYQAQFTALQGDHQQKRDVVDAVEKVKDQQAALRKTVEQQMKEVQEKEDLMQLRNREVELASGTATTLSVRTLDPLVQYFSGYPASFVTILNVLISVIIFFMLAIVYKKTQFISQSFTNGSFFQQSYQPPAAPFAFGSQQSGTTGKIYSFLIDYFPFLGVMGVLIAVIVLTVES
jgi:hypothetical protein